MKLLPFCLLILLKILTEHMVFFFRIFSKILLRIFKKGQMHILFYVYKLFDDLGKKLLDITVPVIPSDVLLHEIFV